MIDISGQPKRGRPEAAGNVDRGRDTDAALYERLAPELIRFATTLVGPSDAEDLLGSAVLKAITTSGWADIENKRAYLYRTIANVAHSARRSGARRRNRELRTHRRDEFEHAHVDPNLMRSLRTLSIRQRAVVHLTYWADLSPSQVAQMLDTSLRTVERELTNARNRLEEELS